MKKIIVVLLLVAALLFLFWAGKGASNKTPAPPEKNGAAALSALTLSQTAYDFGAISMKKGKVTRAFSLTNSGDTPLMIRRVTTSCMCTEAFLIDGERKMGPFGMPGHGSVPSVDEEIPAQGVRTLEVVFDPAAHGPAGVGRIERAVFIEDETGETEVITIKAFVTP